MDSLSVDNVHLLWGGRGRPSVQRRQKSGFSRTLLQRCSGLIDHTGIVIGMDRVQPETSVTDRTGNMGVK